MRRLAAVIVILGVAVLTATLMSRGTGAPPASRLLAFEDQRTGEILSIETHPSSAEAGRFALRVPGRGTFAGVGLARLRSNAAGEDGGTVIVAHYDGDIEFLAPTGTARAPGRLRARLNVARHTAEATLWFGIPPSARTADEDPSSAHRFHLVATGPQPAGLREAALTFRSAMVAGDWGSIYDLASRDLRGGATRDDFIATALAQTPDRIVRLDLGSLGDPSRHPLGFAFAMVTTSATVEDRAGTRRSASHDVYFILEGREWKLWFTLER